jgi:uncharacterized protein (TIGR02996 family)
MQQDQAFLQDICEHPDEDAPRLVFADWLEDHHPSEGAARAEFIRLQCQLARLAPEDRPGPLLRREASLLHDHRAVWVKPLRRIGTHVEFQRGFPEKIHLAAPKFVSVARELFAVAPIRTLRLTQVARAWEDLLKCDELDRAPVLDLHAVGLGLTRVRDLAKCPHLARVCELNLGANKIRPGGLAVLAHSPDLTSLTCLRINTNQLDDDALAELARSPLLPRLRILDLYSNPLTADALRALTRCRGLRLEELDLRGISQQGNLFARILSESNHWTGLRRLDLTGTLLTDEGLRFLAHAAHLSGLTHLRLTRNAITGDGLRALADSPWLSQLRVLDLEANDIGADGIAGLTQQKAPFPALRNLALGGRFEPHDLRKLLEPGRWPHLSHLSLRGPALGPEEVRLLVEMSQRSPLTSLDLGGCRLGCVGVEALVSAPPLAGLVRLGLAGNDIQGAGARAILESPWLQGLLQIDLGGNPGIPNREQKALRARFGPECGIWI